MINRQVTSTIECTFFIDYYHDATLNLTLEFSYLQ